MTTRTDELTEARRIITALEQVKLSASDKRFLESWRQYLNRAGQDAAIGRWRLQQLKRVARSYGIADEPEQGPTTQVVDYLN